MIPYFSQDSIDIYHGSCLELLPNLPAESVQTCVTSPPYFGLRDYGTAEWQGGDPLCSHMPADRQGQTGLRADRSFTAHRPFKEVCGSCGAVRIDSQIGLEPTPQQFVESLVAVFREVWRVLRDDGTLWFNIGDSYANDGKWGGHTGGKHAKALHCSAIGRNKRYTGLKPKDLCMIPARVAIALQDDGWYLRSDIIWSKPNPMPESVTDRPTKAHEYLFLLTKSSRYYYNAEAIKEPVLDESIIRAAAGVKFGGVNRCPDTRLQSGKEWAPKMGGGGTGFKGHSGNRGADGTLYVTRNKRSVWEVSTQPCKEAHFATFPPKLIEPCILAGSKPGDVVLDPFMGAGTTALVAKQLGRAVVGCELNASYIDIAAKRIGQPSLLCAEHFKEVA